MSPCVKLYQGWDGNLGLVPSFQRDLCVPKLFSFFLYIEKSVQRISRHQIITSLLQVLTEPGSDQSVGLGIVPV
jgi:hypothetical protein